MRAWSSTWGSLVHVQTKQEFGEGFTRPYGTPSGSPWYGSYLATKHSGSSLCWQTIPQSGIVCLLRLHTAHWCILKGHVKRLTNLSKKQEWNESISLQHIFLLIFSLTWFPFYTFLFFGCVYTVWMVLVQHIPSFLVSLEHHYITLRYLITNRHNSYNMYAHHKSKKKMLIPEMHFPPFFILFNTL